MTEPLSLSTELKTCLSTSPHVRMSRLRSDLWQYSLGDVEWRIALEKEQGWPRAKRRITVGVAIPLLHRAVDGLGLLNEGYGTIGGNLLVLAGMSPQGTDPAVTLAVREPRLRWTSAARTTWTVETFRREMDRMLTEVALPFWQKFDSLDHTVATLRQQGDDLARRGLMRSGDCQRFITVLREEGFE